nr:hypothetical protein [Tanacetum cinerariifolium]
WLTLVPTPSLLQPFRTPCRHCFPRFAQRFRRSSVPVLDRRVLVEILHRSLFILGLNALISKSPIHLRRRAEIREEFRTSFGPSDAGGNPPPVTIHTWIERFNKQKPHSFEKATTPVDAENWISHMEKIFDVMDCEDAFKTRLAVYKFEGNALAWWKAYKQAKGGDAWLITVTWADFKKLFFLQFFPRAEQERLKREYHSICQTTAGTEEEQAKNFQWGLRRSTLNHLMCMSYTDVAQVANAARNYEILHERDDDDDTERPDKRHRSGDRHQPTTQQSSHRSHGHHNDRHGSDRRGGSDNHRSSNNNYSGSNNRNSGYGHDQRNKGHQSNRSANSGSQQSRGPSEGYSYPVCTTCGCRHPGESNVPLYLLPSVLLVVLSVVVVVVAVAVVIVGIIVVVGVDTSGPVHEIDCCRLQYRPLLRSSSRALPTSFGFQWRGNIR